MREIVAFLELFQNNISKTTTPQMSHIILAMLSMTGRMTMFGLSRRSEKGGSYRTTQRFFHTSIPWAKVFWSFFSAKLFDSQDTFLLRSDCILRLISGKPRK
jgi:hypothetical protein